MSLALSTLWCGVVWCGVVWCGVAWCGVVWCGVVWWECTEMLSQPLGSKELFGDLSRQLPSPRSSNQPFFAMPVRNDKLKKFVGLTPRMSPTEKQLICHMHFAGKHPVSNQCLTNV